jgi:hypothetical protein
MAAGRFGSTHPRPRLSLSSTGWARTVAAVYQAVAARKVRGSVGIRFQELFHSPRRGAFHLSLVFTRAHRDQHVLDVKQLGTLIFARVTNDQGLDEEWVDLRSAPHAKARAAFCPDHHSSSRAESPRTAHANRGGSHPCCIGAAIRAPRLCRLLGLWL